MSVVFPAAGPPVSTILVIRFATRITPSMNVLLLYQFLPRKARIASLCRANGSVGLQYISIFMGKAAFLAIAFSVLYALDTEPHSGRRFCEDAGAAVSGRSGGALRVLAVNTDGQILLCHVTRSHPLSLVWLLFSDAVHSAFVRVRRALAGKARKLSASQMDAPSLYSYDAAPASGADERPATAGLCLPGERGRVARHRSRLRRRLFYRHGLDRTGDGYSHHHMLLKCRIPHSRVTLGLPFVPVALAALYSVLYISWIPWIEMLAEDMTVVQCLLLVAGIESCIRCGLIQSNTDYQALFKASTIRAEITDEALRITGGLRSARAVPG